MSGVKNGVKKEDKKGGVKGINDAKEWSRWKENPENTVERIVNRGVELYLLLLPLDREKVCCFQDISWDNFVIAGEVNDTVMDEKLAFSLLKVGEKKGLLSKIFEEGDDIAKELLLVSREPRMVRSGIASYLFLYLLATKLEELANQKLIPSWVGGRGRKFCFEIYKVLDYLGREVREEEVLTLERDTERILSSREAIVKGTIEALEKLSRGVGAFLKAIGQQRKAARSPSTKPLKMLSEALEGLREKGLWEEGGSYRYKYKYLILPQRTREYELRGIQRDIKKIINGLKELREELSKERNEARGYISQMQQTERIEEKIEIIKRFRTFVKEREGIKEARKLLSEAGLLEKIEKLRRQFIEAGIQEIKEPIPAPFRGKTTPHC